MKRRGLVALFILMLLFVGCPTDDDTGHLDGTWKFDSVSTYIIDTSAMTIEYVDNYKGTIVKFAGFYGSPRRSYYRIY